MPAHRDASGGEQLERPVGAVRPGAAVERGPTLEHVVAAASRTYRDALLPLLLLGLLSRSLFLLSDLAAAVPALAGQALLSLASLALFPAAVFLAFWASAAMVLVASDAYLGRRASLVGSLSGVEACYWHYVGASVIYALLSSAGLLLLVIPGVYVGTVLCLGGCAVVLEGGGVFGALRRSREIVRGSFWRVFIVLLALYAAMGLPQVAAVQWAGGPTPWVQCATHVWLAVLWPLWTAAHVVLYHELVAARGTSAPLEGDEARTREVGGCLLAVLVALGLVLAVAALAFSWSVLLDQVFG